MASISITTEDGDATPSFSSLSPGSSRQPQAIPLSSITTLNLPTANTARQHLDSKKKSDSRHLHPGYSMFDWTRYTQSNEDLTGVGGQILKVSQEELAKHNTEEDAWTVVRGVVYNITPFMKYHPGGKTQLMRGAGNDCTQLFDKIHIWVNSETILKKCIVGVYTGAASTTSEPTLKVKQAGMMGSAEGKEVPPVEISLAVPTIGGSREAEKGEEPAVISLAVPTIGGSREAEKGEEPAVISLPVPTFASRKEAEQGAEPTVISMPVPSSGGRKEAGKGEVTSQLPKPDVTSDSDYLRTTWNSVTGYETSV